MALPDIFGSIFSFLFGLCVGSFLNVCIDRLPRGGSVISPPSHCDACGTRLKPTQLVPLLSYLFLRGRCRQCRAPIGWRVPLVESLTGLFFLMSWLLSDGITQALVTDLFGALLIVVLFIDLEHQLILNKVVYPSAPLALVLSPLLPNVGLVRSVLGGLVGLGIFLAIYLLSPNKMGFGDVKFAFLLGLFAGFPTVFVSILVAVLSGGAVAAGLLLTGRKGRSEAIAFGPFLALGGMVALLWGADLWGWYSRFL